MGQRSKIAVVGAVAVAAAAVVPARAAPACPASNPTVTVELNLVEPVLDNTLPQPKLQQLAGQHHHYGHTLGLYQAQLEVGWRARVRRSEEGREACAWVDEILITVAMPKRTIYIIRERRPGSCPYESVLAHERKHQATDEAVLAEYRPRLQRAAEEAAASLPRRGAPATQLTVPLAAAMKRAFAALTEARTERQSAIDTPAEYRRVRAVCG
jgi:hypothetical protein